MTNVIRRLELLVEEWGEYAPNQKDIVEDIIRCSKKEAQLAPNTANAKIADEMEGWAILCEDTTGKSSG